LSIADSDIFIVHIKHGKPILWKSLELDIPEVLYSDLSTFFKGNEEVIAKWIFTQKTFLANKAPAEILDTEQGLVAVLDFLNRIKTGDIS